MMSQRQKDDIETTIRWVVRIIAFCVIAVVFWKTLPFLSTAFNFSDMFTIEKWNDIVYLVNLLMICSIIFGAPAIIIAILVIFSKLAKGISGRTPNERRKESVEEECKRLNIH